MDIIFIKDIFNPETDVIAKILSERVPTWEVMTYTPDAEDPMKAYDELIKILDNDEGLPTIIGVGHSAMLAQKLGARRIVINPKFHISDYLKDKEGEFITIGEGGQKIEVTPKLIKNYDIFEFSQFQRVITGWDCNDIVGIFSDEVNKDEFLRFHKYYHDCPEIDICSEQFVVEILKPIVEWVYDFESIKNIFIPLDEVEEGFFSYPVDENNDTYNEWAIFRIVRKGLGYKWLQQVKHELEEQPFPGCCQEDIQFPKLPNGVDPETAPIVLGNWCSDHQWKAEYYGKEGVLCFSESFYLGNLLINCKEGERPFKLYCKDFNELLYNFPNAYIGHGNPNANILFIGQEPALDYGSRQYEREIGTNSEQWKDLVTKGFGQYDINQYVKDFDISKDAPDFYSPLHPWPLQKYQVRSIEGKNVKGAEGTSRTWYQYQKLINYIREISDQRAVDMSRETRLDFHDLSFHTDMSAISSKKHIDIGERSKESVLNRMNLLKQAYFQNFDIVIAAVGHFPKEVYGDEYFKEVFDVDFRGDESVDGMTWINVSERKGENPMLLIHMPQISSSRITNDYLRRIAQIVCKFLEKNNLCYFPDELYN